jgi:hypothetical protein
LGTPIEIGPFLIEYDDKPGANEEMTAAQFREIALSFPEAVEAAHMGHPDFRVAGRIFATLGYQNEGRGVLLLSPEEQQEMISQHPKMFEPVPGGWGRHGSTQVGSGANNATRPQGCDEEGLAEESSQTIEQASASA